MIQVHGTEKNPPEWWVKELAIIDRRYKVVYIPEYDYWSIKLTTPYYMEQDGDLRRFEKTTSLATFRILNDAALENLRSRKRLGDIFARANNPNAYLDWIVRMNKEARAKEIELGIEMQVEGFMEIEKYVNRGKHTISSGG